MSIDLSPYKRKNTLGSDKPNIKEVTKKNDIEISSSGYWSVVTLNGVNLKIPNETLVAMLMEENKKNQNTINSLKRDVEQLKGQVRKLTSDVRRNQFQ